MASGPDKAMTCWYCQTTRVWRAWRKGIREKPMFTPLNDAPARTWRIWAGGDAHPSPDYGGGELPGMSAGLRGGRGDVLRGSHGDVAGVELRFPPERRGISYKE